MTLLRGSTKGRPHASVLLPAPPVIHLTVRDQVRLRDILVRETEARLQLKALYEELGLDSRRAYKFLDNGDVREIGKYRRLY